MRTDLKRLKRDTEAGRATAGSGSGSVSSAAAVAEASGGTEAKEGFLNRNLLVAVAFLR